MDLTVCGQPAYAYTGSKKFVQGQPTIVFIHGATNDHSVWQLQSRHFANHGFNVLAVDLPGHGKSGGPACSSVGDYADWIGALLDAAGATPALIVGHSMGSLVAVEVALRRKDAVSGLALLGAALPMPVADPLLDAARNDPASAFDMLNLWGHGPAAKVGRSPIPGISLLGNYRRLLEQSRPGVLYTDLVACNDYRPDTGTVQQIACACLVVIGTRDQMTPPKAGAALAALLAGTETALIEGAGHATMQEAPDAVLDHLLQFARAVAPATGKMPV